MHQATSIGEATRGRFHKKRTHLFTRRVSMSRGRDKVLSELELALAPASAARRCAHPLLPRVCSGWADPPGADGGGFDWYSSCRLEWRRVRAKHASIGVPSRVRLWLVEVRFSFAVVVLLVRDEAASSFAHARDGLRQHPSLRGAAAIAASCSPTRWPLCEFRTSAGSSRRAARGACTCQKRRDCVRARGCSIACAPVSLHGCKKC